MTDDNLNVVPPHLICGKEFSIISENDVINIPDNVNEFKLNMIFYQILEIVIQIDATFIAARVVNIILA